MSRIPLKGDAILGLFVIAIAAMLLIPLPTFLLDLLLVANISFSLLLLLVGLYMPNALALLAFPALLLLTTLFRLGLNVASTRLILSQGDAGEVIQAFGTFLIRGEIVVGVIIFLIITIVNFIVIARGSSRVSEVAARFALDALPGKQMAIDSDLRAGLITPAEAEKRREDLRKESQLYGSMDGAMKFVQGDAIAGFFIILTNILGGLYIGISNGLSVSDAMQTYTTLTVGDGLVSQIPALLISICAGIVVTRVSAEKDSTLGRDVAVQLLQRPANLTLAGVLVLALGLLPGLPFLPFFLMSGIFFGGAYLLRSGAVQAGGALALPALPSASKSGLLPAPDSSSALASPYQNESSQLVLKLDASVLYPSYDKNKQSFQAAWKALQFHVWREMGIHLQHVSIASDEGLTPGQYRLDLEAKTCFAGDVPLDAIFVEMNPGHADIFGFQVLKKEFHPSTGAHVFWCPRKAAYEKLLAEGDISTKSHYEYIALRCKEFVRQNPEQFLALKDVHSRMKEVETQYPGLVQDSLPAEFFTLARITQVMHHVVRQGGGVSDMTKLIEVLSAYASTYGTQLVRDNDFDVHDIVTFYRLQIKRGLQAKYANARGMLRVCKLSSEVQEVFEESVFDSSGLAPVISHEMREELLHGLRRATDSSRLKGVMPVVVLCSQELRALVAGFLAGSAEKYPVLTPAEIGPSLQIETVDVWQI